MKRFLLLLSFCSFPVVSASAQITPKDIPLEPKFSFVFPSDVSISTKMTNARTWIAKTFGDYKSVLQFEDPDNHRIVIKGLSDLYSKRNFDTGGSEAYSAKYTITFDFKDDRYRIAFDDVEIHEVKVLFKGGMIHEHDWSTRIMYATQDTSFFIKRQLQLLDSLNSIQNPPKRDVRRIEKETKKTQDIIETEWSNLKVENADKESKGKIFKQTICELINEVVEAMSASDDF